MIWEYMLNGMACAAWAAGFITILGMFIAAVALICMLMTWACKKDQDEEEDLK